MTTKQEEIREGIEKRIIPDEFGYFHTKDISQGILNYLHENDVAIDGWTWDGEWKLEK